MKNSIKNFLAIAVLAVATFSFTTIEKIKKEVKVTNSKVVWKGYKVTGAHEGLISLKSGELLFEAGKLKGGDFVIDMNSITVTDLEGESKGKLEGHLKSDDFFGVKKYPTASLKFIKVKPTTGSLYEVTADLTIKGNTEPIVFSISVDDNKATTSLKIDRTKFNVRYGSASFFDGLKDKAIYDEFDLIVNLEF